MWPYERQIECSNSRCIGTVVELSEQHTNEPPCFRTYFADVIRPGEVVVDY